MDIRRTEFEFDSVSVPQTESCIFFPLTNQVFSSPWSYCGSKNYVCIEDGHVESRKLINAEFSTALKTKNVR